MEPLLRPTQALKQEAEELGCQGKKIAEYVKQEQALDGEEREAWRDAQKQKLHAEEKKRADEIWLAEIQAESEEEKREQTSCRQKRRADAIKLHIAKIEIEAAKEQAKIEAGKELPLKKLELKPQQDQACTTDRKSHLTFIPGCQMQTPMTMTS